MYYDVEKIIHAIEQATQAAAEFAATEDGGTCNFDSAILRVPRMRREIAQVISSTSGVPCALGTHLGARVLFVGIGEGQGARRTRMAEAAKKSLETTLPELSPSMYYQMD